MRPELAGHVCPACTARLVNPAHGSLHQSPAHSSAEAQSLQPFYHSSGWKVAKAGSFHRKTTCLMLNGEELVLPGACIWGRILCMSFIPRKTKNKRKKITSQEKQEIFLHVHMQHSGLPFYRSI